MKAIIGCTAALMALAAASLAGAAQNDEVIVADYAKPPIVRTDSGLLEGSASDGVEAFKGIPYAAPPVGELRWRAPQKPAAWTGVRAADRYGPICMQKVSKDNGVGAEAPSEDCLYLNVWAPAGRRGRKLPVMVWIHGGGFVNGSGSALLYDGTQLARQGVVLVSLNYRLGRLGFFAHPAIVRGGIGNFGLMDMIEALEWVKRNIAAFGGNPADVTIFGESAGGIAVNDLMVSPAARGLFGKAITESGAGRERPLKIDEAARAGEAFARSMGVNSNDTKALRAIPADKIVAAGDPSVFEGFGPIIDFNLLPTSVAEAFARRREAKVPYIVGANSVEFPSTPANYQAAVKQVAGMTPAQLEQVAGAYPDKETLAANVMGDVLFTEPARHLARLHARNGAPTWLYRFSVLSPSMRKQLKGAPHAQERQYVFQTLAASPWPTDDNDKAQAAVMSAYWISFAKAGDPNGGGRPAWPRYLAAADRLLDFTNDGPAAIKAPYQERLTAIGSLYDSASTSTPKLSRKPATSR